MFFMGYVYLLMSANNTLLFANMVQMYVSF